jgi:hypothetical protein
MKVDLIGICFNLDLFDELQFWYTLLPTLLCAVSRNVSD